ncbi:PTS mannose/fructose/sorbose/N-acetylgalactosamine transporter subunit IIC [Anaerococcus vaginalis]|uniref:PTS mannose/fructose/sorbose/N-acetylgalactosamine transporter subunit IIC n=1 Tax=Anaerococcus vaginalis TaxID=33037 RepID=UPI0024315697|nr:PTS sugar transporter subunit IIC [Anaerococcus vaginalis]MDU1029772.1 PTS sugar transporter subunit IIC [Anaerococcus vaginalis]MDU5373306.1 PTS sugar transporter subunit IIC [Anaerococcus vaginalis]MDU5559813.1 PTS sugar transporter subunit IIC [Anaerococcus vaginalis]MDU5988382.1 PTS sugar transporter subunit IIC [Anaerococcus vaginalis]
METLSVAKSLLIALWVAGVMSRWLLGGASLTLRFSPLMTGLVVGIVMGRVADAMIVTASLQLIYMGVFSPGGSMPSEPAVAAAIAVPVALLGNLTPEASIAIAVPVGFLGSYLYQFRFFLNTFIGKKTDVAIEKMDEKAIKRSIITYPTIASFVLFVPLIFVALYFGAPVIADVVAKLEGTVFLHILDVVGGGLAAIGIATTIYVIGRKDYLLFFLLAYFLSVILKDMNVNMLVYAILGTIISILAVGNKNQAKEDKEVKTETSSERELTFEEEDDF